MTTLVALLVDDEPTFGLAAWHRAIPMLARKGFAVTHVGVVPQKLKKYQGITLIAWYLRVFGLWNTALLAAFSFLERRRSAADRPRTWEEMALHHGLVLRRFTSPNAPEAQEFLLASDCDILFIHVPFILNKTTLSIPHLGTINKHASLLPTCRGLFPYLWARTFGEPQGMSFHEVTADIDAGRILAQARLDEEETPQSMLAFYVWVYQQYAELAVEAAVRLRAGREVPPPQGVDSTYYSLPSRRDRIAFERTGGRIARLADLSLTLLPAEPASQLAEPIAMTQSTSAKVLRMPGPMQRIQGTARS